MKIVIDAMGGDHAPEEIVRGALDASRSVRARLCLVGDEGRLASILAGLGGADRVEIRHADQAIAMDELAGPSLRQKRGASMAVAAQMVRSGEAQAMVCAGNTAALHQVALTGVGRLPGIRRPALAVVFPTRPQPSLALDLGANVDCRPEWLLQFAWMGSIYARKILGRPQPRVGLLSIGAEEGKGNALVAAATPLLAASGLHFVGNVEPGGFFQGHVDVAVCDGFTGNMVLKTGEAVGEWLMDRVRQAAGSSPRARLGGLLLRPALQDLRRAHDHSEYGGAFFLGLKGTVIKCHGRARALTIENGIRMAQEVIAAGLVEQIARTLAEEEAQGR